MPSSYKRQKREHRHARIRAKLQGTSERPRLCVFRSLKQIYAQLIDDTQHKVLLQSSSLLLKKGRGVECARDVGLDLAQKAKQAKIQQCVFDRGGYLYHGQVKALAEGAREGGLQF